ncbi:hypothetical protein KI655_09920 [Vibrio sp. D404a]|uniref:hypothetical protein n=1 Tax=unclassified Vibrio TaxID=2614977 RepID=UPI002555D9B1|nr:MULTISPECIES: hypothetical protein [unclassified Vibrio]MDK9737617.1 hypothetical protein [Vibrio sp. D404a]MDK9797560.1 hypothetical protein [Vibrio sp. D449a]
MEKKSFERQQERIPKEMNGLQVNTCKNPKCANFNKAPLIIHKDGKSKLKRDPLYAISGLGANLPGLKCKSCGEITPVKSNEGVLQELERISAYLGTGKAVCPNSECSNHEVNALTHPKSYYKHGSTNGSPRFQCKLCKKTFSTGSKRRTQRKPEKNKTLFKLIVNDVPVRRACDILEISPNTYYQKVDWLYEQVMRFVKNRELKLLENMSFDRLYLSTDRQVLSTNWRIRKDKRNTEILGIGTADNRTDYIFGWHFNFEPSLKPYEIEKDAISHGDYEAALPHRKHARLWLDQDFQVATTKSSSKKAPQATGSLKSEVELQYLLEKERDNLESSEQVDDSVRLPESGMLVRSEYTMYAHFQFMAKILKNTDKVRFYLDQDTGIRNAFMQAFSDRVVDKSADAFYVKANKDLTIDQKRMLERDCYRKIKAKYGVTYTALPYPEKQKIIQRLILEELGNIKPIYGSKESWLQYPFSTRSEPEKMVAALTDISGCSPEHQANLYKLASLHGIDRFFQQTRRRVRMFERPFSSGTNARRVWYGYSAYNPEYIVKIAEILRVFYNYIHNDRKDKKTPAMRLGLAKGKVTYENIIYYEKYLDKNLDA